MSLTIASLNSGSNGNCYYIGNANEAVLIDVGISCRETERRLKRLELSIKKVKAIFITHEHADHINGLHKLVKKHKIPVFVTAHTRRHASLSWSEGLAGSFQAYEPVRVGALSVTALPKFHDAVDPHSFIVSHAGVNVGVFTDTGRLCEDLVKNFKLCHAAFLESNYDEYMLEIGGYPLALKNRIRGGFGHISNRQALQLFMEHRPTFMTHLLLSHLSKNNNKPEIVEQLFAAVAGTTKIVIATRYQETDVFHIDGRPVPHQIHQAKKQQLSLFDA
ncbi:MAG: MBL fold metallo-hydrolase [Cyclobacteriaceae bacterium]|nr:MBL fold metallo-hydrolase [Cyclobacteriaceae bacterium]